MGHTLKEKGKILARVNRINGQLDAFIKAAEAESDCYQLLKILASYRGALNGVMAKVVEGHIHQHIVEAENKKLAVEADEDLIEIMQSFWK